MRILKPDLIFKKGYKMFANYSRGTDEGNWEDRIRPW
ncbi:MAG: hypothetical protein ACI8YP_003449 [Algoriphagus sp.]|jgi:hypothetical protein